MGKANGEVVIVTGGAHGIGRAYALGLAEEGYRVAVADIADVSQTVNEITALGGEALGLSTDVASEEDTQAMADAVLAQWGRIDGLVNNAAYFTGIEKASFHELTTEDFERMLRINVIGTWLCCRAVFPAMREQGYGKIVNTSSMVVPTATPMFLHYVASKSAIVGLTRSLAREVGPHGITVNTISPCYVPHDASYVAKQEPAMGEAIINERILKREMKPSDLIGTILHLIGHGSDFVTGQNLYVNGGRAFT